MATSDSTISLEKTIREVNVDLGDLFIMRVFPTFDNTAVILG